MFARFICVFTESTWTEPLICHDLHFTGLDLYTIFSIYINPNRYSEWRIDFHLLSFCLLGNASSTLNRNRIHFIDKCMYKSILIGSSLLRLETIECRASRIICRLRIKCWLDFNQAALVRNQLYNFVIWHCVCDHWPQNIIFKWMAWRVASMQDAMTMAIVMAMAMHCRKHNRIAWD